MGSDLQEFLAEDFWLLIGIVTFALTSLAGIAGLEALAGAISVVGWFLLTPLFLFWGEEITTLLLNENESTASSQVTEEDALDELKRRYAEGEIDDPEFEHRLDQLLNVEGSLNHLVTTDSEDEAGRTSSGVSDMTSRGNDSYEQELDPER